MACRMEWLIWQCCLTMFLKGSEDGPSGSQSSTLQSLTPPTIVAVGVALIIAVSVAILAARYVWRSGLPITAVPIVTFRRSTLFSNYDRRSVIRSVTASVLGVSRCLFRRRLL